MVKRYRNGWWLQIKYWTEGRTQREIADVCGVSPRAIRKYMNEFGIPTRDIRGENHPLHGTERPREVRRQISETLDGREFDDETRELMSRSHVGQTLSPQRREKIADSLAGITRSEETRERMSESTAGEKNPNWRGGYSRRYGSGWAVAREKVRERDGVCKHCGHDGRTRRLEVHHVVPVRRFRDDPDRSLESAHELANLVLLCRRCHVKADHGKIVVRSPDAE